jgi:hypothetical protein
MPCREELPEFARAREVLAETHPDVVFSTINLAESGARARSWMEQVGLELPVMLAPMQFMDAYGLMVVPSILVFDRDGRVTVLHSGWVQGTDLVVELTRDLAPLRAKPDR